MSTANKLSILGLIIAIVGIIVSVIINEKNSNPIKEQFNNEVINTTNGEGSHIINSKNGDVYFNFNGD